MASAKAWSFIGAATLLLPLAGCGGGSSETPDDAVTAGIERTVSDVRAARAAAASPLPVTTDPEETPAERLRREQYEAKLADRAAKQAARSAG